MFSTTNRWMVSVIVILLGAVKGWGTMPVFDTTFGFGDAGVVGGIEGDGLRLIEADFGVNVSNGNFSPFAHVVQNDGKIVVGGRCVFPDGVDSCAFRMNADGTTDTTFGNHNGYLRFSTAGAGRSESILSMKGQPDGKIVFAGRSSISGSTDWSAYMMGRLTANGRLDTSFNGTGFFTWDVDTRNNTGGSRLWGVGTHTDGSVYVAGEGDGYSTLVIPKGFIGRMRANGKGWRWTRHEQIGNAPSNFQDLIVDSSGRAVVIGFRENLSQGDDEFLIARYTANGALDKTFGCPGNNCTGYNTVAVNEVKRGFTGSGSFNRGGHALAFTQDSSGSFYLVGGGWDGSGTNYGTLAIFNSKGIYNTQVRFEDYPGQPLIPTGVMVANGGEIYVSGTSRNDLGEWDMFLARFLYSSPTNVVIDSSFGVNGIARIDANPLPGNDNDGIHRGNNYIYPKCSFGSMDSSQRVIIGGCTDSFSGGTSNSAGFVMRLIVDGQELNMPFNPTLASTFGTTAAVPEPTTCAGLWLLAGLALCGRSRRG